MKPNLANDKFFYSLAQKGLIKVSKSGKVFNNLTGRRLGQKIGTNGYHNIGIRDKSGKVRHITIHRLVTIVYGRFLTPKEVVNHLDGDKSNNRFSNLEITTESGNRKHAFRFGLIDIQKMADSQRGASNNNARFSEKQIRRMRRLYLAGKSSKELQKAFEADRRIINPILAGKYYRNLPYKKCAKAWKVNTAHRVTR